MLITLSLLQGLLLLIPLVCSFKTFRRGNVQGQDEEGHREEAGQEVLAAEEEGKYRVNYPQHLHYLVLFEDVGEGSRVAVERDQEGVYAPDCQIYFFQLFVKLVYVCHGCRGLVGQGGG